MKLLRKLPKRIPDPRICLSIALLAAASCAIQPAKAQGAPRLRTQYSQSLPDSAPDAQIYIDFPFDKLKHIVPSLKGLEFDPTQDHLPPILTGVAHSIASALPHLPDLISREDVYHFQSSRDPLAPGGQANAEPWSREFRYLILCHHDADGSVSIEESRTDGKGRPLDLSGPVTSPRGLGFAYQWLLFSAANQPEFRFRYLGQQTKDSKKTFVVAFAQIPEKVLSPANFQSDRTVVPFFFQGVLWIDQSTYDIVLLRTDLLKPIPKLNVRELTTEVHFSSVPIRSLGQTFWLPREVDIATDQGSGSIEENHRYSDFHLFHSTATILPAPSAP
jgi:hypothetical protein